MNEPPPGAKLDLPLPVPLLPAPAPPVVLRKDPKELLRRGTGNARPLMTFGVFQVGPSDQPRHLRFCVFRFFEWFRRPGEGRGRTSEVRGEAEAGDSPLPHHSLSRGLKRASRRDHATEQPLLSKLNHSQRRVREFPIDEHDECNCRGGAAAG